MFLFVFLFNLKFILNIFAEGDDVLYFLTPCFFQLLYLSGIHTPQGLYTAAIAVSSSLKNTLCCIYCPFAIYTTQPIYSLIDRRFLTFYDHQFLLWFHFHIVCQWHLITYIFSLYLFFLNIGFIFYFFKS